MSRLSTYKPLYSVNILQKYYLNKVTNNYFSKGDAEKEKLLAGYKLSDLFSIVPSARTNRKNLRHKYHLLLSGYRLMVREKVSENDTNFPFIPFEDTLNLTFC